jgi:hypothetical protein
MEFGKKCYTIKFIFKSIPEDTRGITFLLFNKMTTLKSDNYNNKKDYTCYYYDFINFKNNIIYEFTNDIRCSFHSFTETIIKEKHIDIVNSLLQNNFSSYFSSSIQDTYFDDNLYHYDTSKHNGIDFIDINKTSNSLEKIFQDYISDSNLRIYCNVCGIAKQGLTYHRFSVILYDGYVCSFCLKEFIDKKCNDLNDIDLKLIDNIKAARLARKLIT